MRKLIYKIRSHYGYSAKEAGGLIILFLLMSIALLVPYGYRVWLRQSNTSADDRLVLQMLAQRKEEPIAVSPEKPRVKSAAPNRLEPRQFDPNTVIAEQLIAMGVPAKLSERWDKYRKSGGTFRKKEDIRKLFGMTDEVYLGLAPYAIFTTEVLETRRKVDSMATAATRSARPSKYLIELNSADTALLVSLPRVGSKSAQRIVEYRQRLGGFRSLEQLKEVYGVDSLMFSVLTRELTLDTSFLIKLNINTVDLATLANHPYVGGKRRATILFNYRNAKGPIKSLEDIVKSKAIDPAFLSKLEPYIYYDTP
jgi:DNA uptake protein ComE-like DNA-binding protein